MKSLLITSNLEGSGAQKAILKLARGLTERGHDVTVLVLERRVEHAPPSGLKLESLLPAGTPLSGGWLGKRALAWRLRRWFRRVTRSAGFDLIVSTLRSQTRTYGSPGLSHVWFRIANTLSSELAELSGQKAKRRHGRYASCTKARTSLPFRKALRNKVGLPKARIETIYNPFDVEKCAQ